MDRVLEKRRLKDKYFKNMDKILCAQLEQTFLRSSTSRANRYKLGLALIIEGVLGLSGTLGKEILDAKKKKKKAISYTVHNFPIAVQLHVTLHPTEAERGQPHIATLLSFNDPPILALDDLDKDNVPPQFHSEPLAVLVWTAPKMRLLMRTMRVKG
ncbi:Hypothetical predicted protein [Olea europaea subsp. europaea]|uniref:Uncharacterized protein n=1 Tax=Olea europaea subsp. europaea TaxID=158383 RepID=A0A8S0V2E5_OLEEU|nr:Hypothetical predicted protein [Olea europaea subsp. europaea]